MQGEKGEERVVQEIKEKYCENRRKEKKTSYERGKTDDYNEIKKNVRINEGKHE